MCGIAGIYSNTPSASVPAALAVMAQKLAHRGRDGQGTFHDGCFSLQHTRLSIVDVAGGVQPFVSDNLAVVANGEIYNHLDLRRAFNAYPYVTQSDCETILPLYTAYGTDFVKHLRGMYAIAIVDRIKKRLILARDPFGIKPLYYAYTEAGLLFASEPQALLASTMVSWSANTHKIAEIFHRQFTSGAETVFAGIFRVLPGEVLVFENGQLVSQQIIQPLTALSVSKIGSNNAATALHAKLQDSVALHQSTEVPFGLFLSGGIDSATLAHMVKRRPLIAYTAWFPESPEHQDERQNARDTAKAVGLDHRLVEVTAADFYTKLPRIAAAMDDPVTDYALIPTFCLAEHAAKDVKVVLIGEGADEVLAGYGRYRKYTRPWPFGKISRPRSSFSEHLQVLQSSIQPFDPCLSPVSAGYNRLQTLQARDCGDPLSHGLLAKVDRCLMYHGIEGRVPFLDMPLAQFCFALPDRLKIRGGYGKWLLRQHLHTHLPTAPAFARKRGFTVPVGDWIAAKAETLGALVAAQSGIQEFCDPAAVRAMFAAPRRGAVDSLRWKLLFFALWHQHHFCGVAGDGSIEEVLAQQPMRKHNAQQSAHQHITDVMTAQDHTAHGNQQGTAIPQPSPARVEMA